MLTAQRMAHHTHISANHRLLDLHLDELWRYRDLVWLLTRRSFVVTYKQTVLGPLWLLLSPLLTSLVYVVLFGNIARLSTVGVPQLLFYLLGTALWTYFSTCVTANATTFVDNANLFGKVYFPRLAVPVSRVLGALIHLGIQMLLVLVLIAYYAATGAVHPAWALWPTVPLALLVLGCLGMGFGIVISSLTTRYRDLSVLVGFGVSLRVTLRSDADVGLGTAWSEPFDLAGPATHELTLELPLALVARGTFYLSVGVFNDDGTGRRQTLDHVTRALRIEVLGSPVWNTTALGYLDLPGLVVRQA